MEHTWRTSLETQIQSTYIQEPDEWFEMNLSTNGQLNLTIVSERFKKTTLPERKEQIQAMLHNLQIPIPLGFLSLYTFQEAESIGLSKRPTNGSDAVYSWHDLANWAANTEERPKIPTHQPRIPRTIAFYSFKGGVGRTTALTHVAAILATRGRKVVAVDLDLEAPGLSSALNLHPLPPYGIVDYFYERSYMPDGDDIKPDISIAEIFGEVTIPNASGRLFVVPAGSLNLDYIAKVDDLRANTITAHGEDLWSIFFREINEQLQPDIILVDSRTGINEWGAFSLLRAADKAVIFLYPNEQNRKGIDLLLQALSGKISLQLVFSPVPFGESGADKVREHWLALQNRLDISATQDVFDVEEEDHTEAVSKTQIEFAEPITIQYFTELALASNYPVPSLLSHYMRIANVVDEDTTAINLETILKDATNRRNIIKSLEFPVVDATSNQNIEYLFQRTIDFDRVLDATTCLILGIKGTGKTTLYTLLLRHAGEAKRLSRKYLDSVTSFSGHGSFRARPEKDDFQLISKSIEQFGGSWEAFWRSYLFLRMQQENLLQELLRGSKDTKYQKLHSLLNEVGASEQWNKEYTDLLINMTKDAELNLLLKDALFDINRQLQKNSEGEILWFLYDDLNVDFREENELRKDALTGLFQLVQACDARRLKHIDFKIFLREDIWQRLIFDDKSHFNGRNIILRWRRLDFLRLALRQAQQSIEFKDLVDRFSPIENIDQADEETIDRALQLLWGSRQEQDPKSEYVSRWVYRGLIDSSRTSFPRSVNILLKTAKEYELNIGKRRQVLTDRLLSPESLIEGLMEASEERCQDLRKEYRELIPFFDSLAGLNIFTPRGEFYIVWQKTMQITLPEFKNFANVENFLRSIGLIRYAELSGESGYQFADIYTHGFKINHGARRNVKNIT